MWAIIIVLYSFCSIALAWQGLGHARFRPRISRSSLQMEIFADNPTGLKIWNAVWKLPVLQPSEQGISPTKLGDAAQVLKGNIMQIYGNETSFDGAPVAEGAIDGLLEGTLYLGLQQYYNKFGSVYKLLFGPKSFIIISDPAIARSILKDNPKYYDKGVLAEILKPIMGKGLIPADPETWKVRRKAIVPGFHRGWYDAMGGVFSACTQPLVQTLFAASQKGEIVDMEEKFCSVSLDIIGKAVFNYDFGSVTKESPVIKAVYALLKEAEHRSMTPFPYWDLPLANLVVPRLRYFHTNLELLDNVLKQLIDEALSTRNEVDVEDLQRRDMSKLKNPSLLRFLVDMRGEDVSSTQLRDDLMTMLVAGHETTAALLTWALYEVAQQPDLIQALRKEIDGVFGEYQPTHDGAAPELPSITLDMMQKLLLVRMCLAESLRMYPQPPLLIRRAITDHAIKYRKGSLEKSASHTSEGDNDEGELRIQRGTDIFLSIYNIHRSARFYDQPDNFIPQRWLQNYSSPSELQSKGSNDETGWAGYTTSPSLYTSALYPNEVHSDFAFLPFGAGPRKCIGDNFAFMESIIIFTHLLRHFDFTFSIDPKEVGTTTGATIHTRNGLLMTVKTRKE